MDTTSQMDRGAFFDHYVTAALWSSTDAGEPLDANYGPEDFDTSARLSMARDCEAFMDAHAFSLASIDAEQAGHDFWLTRNEHGAGFWDRGLGELGDRLTDAAHAYGSQDIYVGDDGRLYVS